MSDPLLRPLAAGDTGPDILQPQADRLRWEREWLQQQRHSPPEQGLAARRDAWAPHSAPVEATAAPAAPPAPGGKTPPGAGSGSGTAASTLAPAQSLPPAASPIPAPGRAEPAGTAAVLLRHLPAPARPSAPAAAPAIPSGQEACRRDIRFALWHRDDGVGIALRLPEQAQGSERTLQAMRQWVREAGLKLAALFINGKLRGASAPPPADGY